MPQLLRLLALVLLGWLSSCTTSTFLKTAPPTPLFEQAGEVEIAGHVAPNNGQLGVAVAPKKHIAFLAQGLAEVQNRYYGELGAGYWSQLGNQKKWTLEAFAGYGYGRIDADYRQGYELFGQDNEEFEIEASYHRVFIQANAGFAGAPRRNFGGTIRASFVHYPRYYYLQVREAYTDLPNDLLGREHVDDQRTSGWIFDPALFWQWGLSDRVQAQIQAGLSISQFDIDPDFDRDQGASEFGTTFSEHLHPRFSRLTLNIGLVVSLGRLTGAEE